MTIQINAYILSIKTKYEELMHNEEQKWIITLEEWRITTKRDYELRITEITTEFDNMIKVFIELKQKEYDDNIALLIEQWTLTLHEDTQIIILNLKTEMEREITVVRN
jgi:maltodextrin utilization protein YvdJ